MKYSIPTYNEALAMVKAKGELVFYETKHVINGYDVSFFNYRLAQYSDFTDIKSREMRGICYVFNKDGSVFNTHLMLNKFWNINQVEETMLYKLADKKIKSIYNKEDGSLISFIKLPNGEVVTKTKMGIGNDQTVEVDKIKTDEIMNFVEDCFDKGYSTMWEYVSYKNKIVLNYNNSNLVLLRVRDNKTGEYIDIEQFRGLGFDVVKSEKIRTLTEMLKWAETAVDIEGCVITFEDDSMCKLKTLWYFYRHRLLTENVNREDAIIAMILNETIDDVRSQLHPINDAEKIIWVAEIEKIVLAFLSERIAEVDLLVSKYNGEIKDFAIRYRKDKNFAIAINVVRGKENSYNAVKSWLLSQTSKLEQARSFINRKGFKKK